MYLVERMTTPMSSGNSDSTSNATMVIMSPFTTEIGGSILWFNGWMPTTGPSTLFACVGLFFLAAFSRFLEAFRLACTPFTSVDLRKRSPFVPECVCAVLFTVWSAISYFLMLAVMQLNVWFFIAILIGLGVGELGFGRYCRSPGVSRIRLSGLETSELYKNEYQSADNKKFGI